MLSKEEKAYNRLEGKVSRAIVKAIEEGVTYQEMLEVLALHTEGVRKLEHEELESVVAFTPVDDFTEETLRRIEEDKHA
jgi:hypothetical protein